MCHQGEIHSWSRAFLVAGGWGLIGLILCMKQTLRNVPCAVLYSWNMLPFINPQFFLFWTEFFPGISKHEPLLFSDAESSMLHWGPHSGGFIGFKLLLLSDYSLTLPFNWELIAMQIMTDTSVFLTKGLSTLLGIKHNTPPIPPPPQAPTGWAEMASPRALGPFLGPCHFGPYAGTQKGQGSFQQLSAFKDRKVNFLRNAGFAQPL